MSRVVLDATALLTLINAEPGAEVIARYLKNAEISAITLSEVVTILAEMGMPLEEITRVFDRLGIKVHPFARNTALTAALLRSNVEDLELTISDRASLALAMQLGSPVITVNPLWDRLDAGVPVKIVKVRKPAPDKG